MNTKFTKGPWRVRGDESVMVFADAGLEHIAACVTEDIPLIVRQANTALIASAPELYEALAMLAEYPLEAFGKENSKPDTPLFGANGWTLTVGDVLNARAVLKKARGEA